MPDIQFVPCLQIEGSRP